MNKKPTIFVFIIMFVCAVLLAYAITCGIYAVKGYVEQIDAKKQEKIKQEQIRIEKIKQQEEENRRKRCGTFESKCTCRTYGRVCGE